jgi:8-amino-7-oxononanoate synthase
MRATVVPDLDPAAAAVRDDARTAGCRTLVELFRLRAEGRPDREAYRFLIGGESTEPVLTYGELDARARAIAVRLRELASAGDRAILLFAPGLDYVAAFVGCLYAGVIAVPAYPPSPRRPDARVPGIVADCGARVALTTGALLTRLGGWRAAEPALRAVSWLATDGIDDEDGARWENPGVGPEALAMLQYTSGSTAAPRGVMLTHANLMTNLAIVHRSFAHREQDQGVFWLPPFHDMGLIGAILQTAYVGLGTALMSPTSFLQRPLAWLEAISRFRATTSGAPNFAYDLCVDRSTPEERAALDLSSWRTAFSGAEPVRADTIERFVRAFEVAGFRREAFLPCYGLAEATLMVTGGPFGVRPAMGTFARSALERGVLEPSGADDESVELVASGRPIAEHDVRIVDPERGVECGEGSVGEIWVAGESVGCGYWGRGDDGVFGARLPSDTRRWLRTGDLGAFRGEQLFVTGRRKDVVIIGGRNIYPQDVELAAERSHPGLRPGHAAAFGVAGDGRERLVLALEVSRHAEREDLAPLFRAVRISTVDRVGIAPDEIVFVRQGTIPRTSSGKIRRGATRDALLDGSLVVVARSEQSSPASRAPAEGAGPRRDVRAWLVEWVERELGRDPSRLTDAHTLRDLGLESLDAVRLVIAAERELGVRVDTETLWSAATVGDVARALAGGVHAAVATKPGADDPLGAVAALESRLAALDAAGLEDPFFVEHEGTPGATTIVAGRALLSFGSYNYLGLSGHPSVSAAAHEAIERYGTSVSASRVISGERAVHAALEHELAEFLGVEAALAFVSGHATNVSTIASLVGEGDLVVADALAHDSVVQGARLSGARRLVFPHNDADALDALLGDVRGGYRRALIVVEGVYSADGDIPNLGRLVEVKRRHNALLMVDEAHSIGVLGPTGRGLCEHAGVAPADVDIHMGTLSKALASSGGYVAGSRGLVRLLRYTAPGFVFSVGMTPADAAAAHAALRVLRAEPDRVARLRDNAALFLDLAREAGADTGASSGSAVVPAIVGDSLRAVRVAQRLRELGVSAAPMVAPSVPERQARIRFFVTSEHTREQLHAAAAALRQALRDCPT